MYLFAENKTKNASMAYKYLNNMSIEPYFNFNLNFILPKVNTDYMRQAQVLNIDKLRLIINLRKFNENVK